ncbi:venom allergen 5 [Drosophila navojoa]|uniref:venom allergen 5 n=1 Tax=Drosophila navojoa TaxID=7232 RepID=UPI0008469DDA|nr:venom allergen 5 [Drosophila navojoa]
MRRNLVFPLLGLLSIVRSTAAVACPFQQYCSNGTTHVLCFKRKLESFHKRCGDKKYRLISIDGSLREDVLFRLNYARNLVASGLFDFPAAANMPTLTWDDFLVETAEKLAFTCDTTGQYCSNSKAYHYVASVRIGTHFVKEVTQKSAVKDLLNIWIRDMLGCKLSGEGLITRKNVKNTTCLGHFTPLLEDHCNKVGCVIVATLNENGNTAAADLICNLNRANVNSGVPYTISTVPGDRCNQGRDFVYEFLCKPSEPVENNYIPPKRSLDYNHRDILKEPLIVDIVKIT